MELNAKQRHDLDNSMVAAQNAKLGSFVGSFRTHSVTGAEASASKVELNSVSGNFTGILAQANRSGSTVTFDAKITGQGGSVITIEGGSTYKLTADDKISYFVI